MSRWLKRIGAAFGIFLALLLVYGVIVEPRLILDEEHLEASLPRLGEDLAGTEVAVVTDFQLGMWFANTGMVERAVETAIDAGPDAVLLGGDFLYSNSPGIPEQIDTLLDVLEPLLESDIPAFAVLGNHDYAIGAADELTAALEENGIAVLLNTAEPVPGLDAADDLYVVGIGSALPEDHSDVDAALADVPDDAPRVVLMHNPTVFPELPAQSAPLAVAGHTHCGQVTLPGTPHWAYIALTEEEKIVAEGWAPEDYGAAGNSIFVTCGIGFSVVPIRINAPPEVAFFELRPGN